MKLYINSKQLTVNLVTGVNNYQIHRIHIEQLILSTLLNAHLSHPMDELELIQYKVPFKLFKANKTHKLVAKAIYNLREENKNIDDMQVISYITKHTTLNEQEFLESSSYTWTTFDMMIKWVKQLKEMEEEQNKINILKGL